ncbi:MAG: S-layer homology domain-containing protein [Clostridiales bacterium]|nr:S-layer homology domain-containing protein [Clostridiales bacterium]
MKRLITKTLVIVLFISVFVGLFSSTSSNSTVLADNEDSIEKSSTNDKDRRVIAKENSESDNSYTFFDPEAIIGKDNRSKISDPTKFPYSAIARLEFVYPCGCSRFSTGFMISDYTMLASRAYEYCDKHNNLFKTVKSKFGYSYSSGEENYLLYSNNWASYYTTDPYTDDSNYMYIEFESPVGSLVGHFGIKAFENKALDGKTFKVGGYSVDNKQPLKIASGKVSVCSGENYWMLKYNADTVSGNGGGPLFDDKNYVAGIHIGGSAKDKYNYSQRITQGIMDELYELDLIDNSKLVKPEQAAARFVAKDGGSYLLNNRKRACMCIPDVTYNLGDVNWSSSDESVASINGLGVISAHKIGETVITAEYGNTTVSIKILVAYEDVKDTSKFWFVPTYYMSIKDVVKGYDNQTKFKPANNCTRAQMVTFLWRLEGCPKPSTSKCIFSDVKKSDYFYKAVIWGNENGIVEGYSDGTFGPQKTCKRRHAVTFLWRLAGEPEPGTKKNNFSDISKKDYYYKAVLWASKNKIVAGYSDGTFKPNGDCLRRQMVTFLYKYDQLSQSTD